MPLRPLFRFGIPALALGQGLAEGAFVLLLRAGIAGPETTAAAWALLAGIPALVILRFILQDRGAVLEAAALRETDASWRTRLFDALRAHAVPVHRGRERRAVEQALEDLVPRAVDGTLARRNLHGSLLHLAVLVPLLVWFSWKAALAGLATAALLWPLLRWRNRALKAVQSAAVAGRAAERRARAVFTGGIESRGATGIEPALRELDARLEAARGPAWRWKRAQGRHPAVMEAGLFFVLVAILAAGATALPHTEILVLFALLLVLTYRPVREAARQYPVASAGAAAERALEERIAAWQGAPPRRLPEPNAEPALELRGVTFAYEPGGPDILHGVHLAFPLDKVTGIAGPNGAGKSTVLRLLSGVEIPVAGAVRWPEAVRTRGITCLPQRAWPGPDWIDWARGFAERDPVRYAELDALLDLAPLLRRAGDGNREDVDAEEWSGGQRQRMALARALASDAAFLLLDEPVTALPADRREPVLRGALAFWTRDGRGAVVVSHEPFLPSLCDALIRMDA